MDDRAGSFDEGPVQGAAGVAEVGTRMVLDGAALTNLEVLVNAQDGTVQGSLWQLLNKTTSPFGKVQICVRP